MGEFFMFGAYIHFFLLPFFGAQYWVFSAIAASSVVFVIGVAYQLLLLRPAHGGTSGVVSTEYFTVITVTSTLLFRNLVIVAYGPYIYGTPDYMGNISIGAITINGSRALTALLAAILLFFFYFSIKKTWAGKRFQAVAQNRSGAHSLGINPSRVDQMAFGLSAALAALAGALLSPVFLVYPACGSISTVKGFEIIVIGGLGSIPGSIVGGVFLGALESVGAAFFLPAFRDVYGFLALIFVLVVSPTGLFGEKRRKA
jgi:branched-chain amino acid transport system permease protein